MKLTITIIPVRSRGRLYGPKTTLRGLSQGRFQVRAGQKVPGGKHVGFRHFEVGKDGRASLRFTIRRRQEYQEVEQMPDDVSGSDVRRRVSLRLMRDAEKYEPDPSITMK